MSRRAYLQGYPSGSCSTDSRSDFQYGQIRQNQPLHDMDSYCLGSAYLVIGLLPHLDYHCCRYRRIPVRKAALPENQQLKIKQTTPLIANH